VRRFDLGAVSSQGGPKGPVKRPAAAAAGVEIPSAAAITWTVAAAGEHDEAPTARRFSCRQAHHSHERIMVKDNPASAGWPKPTLEMGGLSKSAH
jgi:hypothetical protein